MHMTVKPAAAKSPWVQLFPSSQDSTQYRHGLLTTTNYKHTTVYCLSSRGASFFTFGGN